MSKIHDTLEGERAQGFHLPSNIEFTDMVTLFWTHFSGERFETVYPRSTANEFLAKHLIPQKEQGLLSDVGIKELQPLGTF